MSAESNERLRIARAGNRSESSNALSIEGVWRIRHIRALTCPLPGRYLAGMASAVPPSAFHEEAAEARLAAAPTRGFASQTALIEYYKALQRALGPQKWWPARTPFEVIVGAILTQNTAWTNVEKAIGNLRRERLLTPQALERVPQGKLGRLVRSSGYFRQKAKKLKAFVRFMRKEYGGSLERMFRTPTAELRERLLSVHGIGPETADSILLYAGGHAVFVVDAYTKRVLVRHGLMREKAGYNEIRAKFEENLPRDAQLFNEFHALLVMVGKNWCRTKMPLCQECPLERFLPDGFVQVTSGVEAHERNKKGRRFRHG